MKINNILIVAGLAFMSLLAAVSILQGVKNGAFTDGRSQDFQWGPARNLMQGNNPYTQYLAFVAGESETNPYMMAQSPQYPSSTYVFLFPYAALDWPIAKLAWAVSNVIFAILILVGLNKLYPIQDKRLLLFIVCVFLAATPFRNIVGNGQHALISIAAFICSLVLCQKNKYLAGILLAVSWIKYSITFPLTLIFLAKRNYWVLSVSVEVHVVFTLFVAFWIKEWPHEFFFKSLQVNLSTLMPGDVNLSSLAEKYSLPSLFTIAGSLVILAMTAWSIFKYKGQALFDDLLLLSFLSVVSYTLLYHLRYDLVVLIFPLWMLAYNKLDKLMIGLTSLLVATAWFGLKVMDVGMSRVDLIASLYPLVFIVYAIMFYGLLYILFSRLKSTSS